MNLCSIKNCLKEAPFQRTICSMHRNRKIRTGVYHLLPRDKPSPTISCTVKDCLNSTRYGAKVCVKHYARFRRYGSYELPIRVKKIKSRKQINLEKKESKFKNKFGITILEYDRMVEERQNKCDICGNFETRLVNGKIQRLSIDHCHKAELLGLHLVRGLLCNACNIGIGFLQDNPIVLRNAIQYLEKPRGLGNALKTRKLTGCD